VAGEYAPAGGSWEHEHAGQSEELAGTHPPQQDRHPVRQGQAPRRDHRRRTAGARIWHDPGQRAAPHPAELHRGGRDYRGPHRRRRA